MQRVALPVRLDQVPERVRRRRRRCARSARGPAPRHPASGPRPPPRPSAVAVALGRRAPCRCPGPRPPRPPGAQTLARAARNRWTSASSSRRRPAHAGARAARRGWAGCGRRGRRGAGGRRPGTRWSARRRGSSPRSTTVGSALRGQRVHARRCRPSSPRTGVRERLAREAEAPRHRRSGTSPGSRTCGRRSVRGQGAVGGRVRPPSAVGADVGRGDAHERTRLRRDVGSVGQVAGRPFAEGPPGRPDSRIPRGRPRAARRRRTRGGARRAVARRRRPAGSRFRSTCPRGASRDRRPRRCP